MNVAMNPTIWLAFGAGFLSFISPCTLPLYPSYISYITGISVAKLKEDRSIIFRQAMIHTLFFVLGFSIIFISLGLTATLLGSLFAQYQNLIRQLGGILILVMGLFMVGLFKPSLFMREKRFDLAKKPAGYFGSVLVGVSFAAGWTPCIGPILTAVLTIGASDPNQGIPLIVAYTLGFALPFIIMAFFIGRTQWIQRHSQKMMKFGGIMMILLGVLLYTNKMTDITIWLISIYGGFTGF
ncbi:cytochrome C biogenesis protein CcdA [Ammoniphilus oxalaticus]|uniref:Cytochrome C biogenesis protein CcdA n=1 Tax=Ammoniphilus oxalaticus TaxID=66863 RepID=A0A419SJ11_9BACL|nr:cytochrome c biogenesis protein CcdA [Ammoniphilus oxalaticus]RKD24024.1 cytochrome C biogenesis protein CcdA [Ammoniphilus oxalaticus]